MTTEKLIELGVDKAAAEKAMEIFEEEISSLKSAHKEETDKLSKENESIKIGFEINRLISEIGVWSERAVYALIDFDKIGVENGEVVGVREEIERIRTECGILFKDNAVPRIVSCADSNISNPESAVRNAMGI